MKTRMKSLAAAVMIGMTGAVNAAIDDDGLNNGNLGSNAFGSTGGVGELFMSVIARDAGNPSNNESIVVDYGGFALAEDFVDNLNDGTLASYSFSAPGNTFSELQTFLTDHSAFDISYNLLAVHNSETYDPNTFTSTDLGYVTSASNPLGAGDGPQGITDFNTPSIDVFNYINNNNNAAGTTDIAEHLASLATAADTHFHDGPNWGNDAVFGFQTEAFLGELLDVYFIGTDNTNDALSRVPAQLGTAQLLSDGTFTFNGVSTAVPVPAAVWLFGSGLVGLISVARRRKID